MNKFIRLWASVGFLFIVNLLCAQEVPKMKFGKVTVNDFSIASPIIDSNTNAVVLADIGNSEIIGNDKGWFSLAYSHMKRVKIINKKGMDAADVSIILYKSENSEEKLDKCKAITYNLENGQVMQTKLESSNIFKEKKSKNQIEYKFTFPNVKEGSILEYSYTVESEFIEYLRSWDFQGANPVLYTQYSVRIPEFFVYSFLDQGYYKTGYTKKDRYQTYNVSVSNGALASDRYSISGGETEHTWNAFNVPALKEERYTSSIDNHISRIDFQLSKYRFPNTPEKNVLGNWASVSELMLKHESFGNEITRPNFWLNDDVKKITTGRASEYDKAHAIYTFVRDNFTCSGKGYWLPDNTTLRDVFRKKNGNVAEINLLLIAMLRSAGIIADPVLISTRENGWASPYYPLMTKYNYVICKTAINNETIYLDATEPKIGFGKLASYCYNGPGFVIKQIPENIRLESESLNESKTTMVFLMKDDKGELSGFFDSNTGYYESTEIREKISKSNVEQYLKEIGKGASPAVVFNKMRIDSLLVYDKPIKISGDIKLHIEGDDILYLNPLFGEGITTNPFASADRQYPVEMPYKLAELFILNMEIPQGYKVEELPKSLKALLNDDEGSFEYLVSASPEKIILQSKINIKRANFSRKDYQTLREFFGLIVQKHNEQIVLKKIK